MKLRWIVAAIAAIGLACGVARAEEKKMEAPKPGPELQKLSYYVGTWHSDGEMKPGPWGPGGKFAGEDHCAWMEGGFFVVCNTQVKGTMGNVAAMGIMGYDAATKMFTWNGFNSMGENEKATGSNEGSTWTYTGESMLEGKPMKTRYSMSETSPTAYTFHFDSSADGKTWTTVMEGKVAKAAQ